MKKILTLLLLAMVAVGLQAQELRFNPEGKFKIVQLTDTHFIYGDNRSQPALDCVDHVLNTEKPDLVILTGDIIFGKPAKESMLTIINRVAAHKIPYAITFGNHDDEFGLSRRELMELVADIPYNITSTTEGIDGVTNYTLPVCASDGSRSWIIYVFDSLAYSQIKGVDGYDHIRHSQIDWYTAQSRQYAADARKALPSLAFFHIPLSEYTLAANNERAPMVGNRMEAACPPRLNSGLFASFVEQGDVKGVFVGHEHDNDYLTSLYGIALAYGRMSGGSTVYNHLPVNGARVIELTEGSDSFATWIRLSNGAVEQSVIVPDYFKH